MTHRVDYDTSPIDATITSRAFWLQVLDRSIKTALQAAVVFLGGGVVGLTSIDWKQALASIGVTVLITVLFSLTSSKLYEVESFYIDLFQRAARTFVATFLGSVVAIEGFASIDWGQAASLAASATLLSIMTNYGVRNAMGTPDTASVFRNAELIPVTADQVVGHVSAASQQIIDGATQARREIDRVGGEVHNWMQSQQRPPQ